MLLDKLTQKQKELGESDKTFAKHLGVHRTTWMHTRNKKIRLGESIIQGALRRFPELKEDVIFFLASSDNLLPTEGIKLSKPNCDEKE